ncbi:hypothetical protein OUZ56_013301 [Daphnia magna]|uniref:GMPS ATP-PPase domain-containing protein n=1 Tax=Daphnia magna TaxID=35525 RepID=A0ABQ9Z5H0_9CRUS|nr:hypothetical protein OUZ56_013301 [Daphnia magna]
MASSCIEGNATVLSRVPVILVCSDLDGRPDFRCIVNPVASPRVELIYRFGVKWGADKYSTSFEWCCFYPQTLQCAKISSGKTCSSCLSAQYWLHVPVGHPSLGSGYPTIICYATQQGIRFLSIECETLILMTGVKITGRKMLHKFLFDNCGLQGGFTLEKREQQCIDYVRRTVGRNKMVLVLESGGVDSAVCVALLHKALLQGDDSLPVQDIDINIGFLRKDESEQVITSLQQLELNLRVVKASRQTLSLFWTVNPEGNVELLAILLSKWQIERLTNLKLSWDNLLLGQGALRPDFIESASQRAYSRADAIKTQRFRNGSSVAPSRPRNFHKDEVVSWVCPKNYILERHPFPGPGLSIQIIYAEELFMEADFGETQVLIRLMIDYANMAAKEHALLYRIEIATSGEERFLLEELSIRKQFVAKLLSIRAVGVQGDCRTNSYCIPLSSDQTQPNWNDLATYARLIPRVCHNVDRVCYIFGKPVRESVTNVTPTFLTGNILDFMTGLSGIPYTHLPQEARKKWYVLKTDIAVNMDTAY